MESPEQLAANCTTRELDEARVVVERITGIETRCFEQDRDATTRERGILESSLAQLKPIKRAIELRESLDAAESEERASSPRRGSAPNR